MLLVSHVKMETYEIRAIHPFEAGVTNNLTYSFCMQETEHVSKLDLITKDFILPTNIPIYGIKTNTRQRINLYEAPGYFIELIKIPERFEIHPIYRWKVLPDHVDNLKNWSTEFSEIRIELCYDRQIQNVLFYATYVRLIDSSMR